jgi:hypothetical protein
LRQELDVLILDASVKMSFRKDNNREGKGCGSLIEHREALFNPWITEKGREQ